MHWNSNLLTSYRGLIFGSLLVLPRSCSQGDVEIAKANVHSRLQKLLVTTRVTVARVEVVVVVVVISEASGVLLRIGTVASEWKALARYA